MKPGLLTRLSAWLRGITGTAGNPEPPSAPTTDSNILHPLPGIWKPPHRSPKPTPPGIHRIPQKPLSGAAKGTGIADPPPPSGTSAKIIPMEPRRLPRPAPVPGIAAISDCENLTEPVTATLHFIGVLGRKGKVKNKAKGIQIVQTGDLLHKNCPDPKVTQFWQDMRQILHAGGCRLQLIAGNHEMEIWHRLSAGEQLGLKRRQRQAMLDLIGNMTLFHVADGILFIHGYPTVHFLRHLRDYQLDSGKHLNDYNRDHFRKALNKPKILRRYRYLRKSDIKNPLLHDITDPARYYRRHGAEVASLLKALGIDLVIHGHRPERNGTQTDYELRQRLPGIRMISNDVQLRFRGLGATIIGRDQRQRRQVCLINHKRARPADRANARNLIRNAIPASAGSQAVWGAPLSAQR